uniref:Gag-pol polyprotein n=1 Tax=Solanum tuberosum TaxID=4113 RepID=M1D8J8_SOLTU
MSMKEYALKFMQLSNYVPTMVVDPRARMSKFVSGASDLVVKECLTVMLVKEIDVSHFMVHAQQIEEEKLKDKTRDSKRPRREDGESSHSRFDGGNCSPGKASREKMWPECQKCGRRNKAMREIIVDGLNPTLSPVLVVAEKKIGYVLFKLDKIMRVPRMRRPVVRMTGRTSGRERVKVSRGSPLATGQGSWASKQPMKLHRDHEVVREGFSLDLEFRVNFKRSYHLAQNELGDP